MVVRWGGDEFLVLMLGTSLASASMIIRRMWEKGFGERPGGGKVTASSGLAEWHEVNSSNWQELVNLADNRMYQAKQSGRYQLSY